MYLGVDYGTSLGAVYHLASSKFDHLIVLKSSTPNRVNPSLDSVVSIWETANYQEREIFDLFGITFKNHPYMKRLFLDSSWGFPLRKDYIDDINIISK